MVEQPRRWGIVSCVALCFGLGACGGGGGGDGGPVGPWTGSVEEFWNEYMHRACERVIQCESKSPLSVIVEPLMCHPAGMEALAQESFDSMNVAIAAGRIAFDSARAQQCLDAISTPADCSPTTYWGSAVMEACTSVFSGLVPPGGDCAQQGECRLGSRCEPEEACPGTCVEGAGAGEPCTDDEDCALDLVCGADSRCGPPVPDGDECQDYMDCTAGRYCSDGVCDTLPGAGDTCVREFGTSWCAGDLLCVGDSDAGTAVCARGSAVGEICGEYDPCAVGGRCVNDSCVRVSLPGGPCDDVANCPVGFVCELGSCRPQPVVGEPCDADRPCIQGACQDGFCRLLADGEPCDGGDLFAGFFGICVGYCTDDGAGGDVCAPAAGQGEACDGDDECRDPLICAGDEGFDPGTCQPICLL